MSVCPGFVQNMYIHRVVLKLFILFSRTPKTLRESLVPAKEPQKVPASQPHRQRKVETPFATEIHWNDLYCTERAEVCRYYMAHPRRLLGTEAEGSLPSLERAYAPQSQRIHLPFYVNCICHSEVHSTSTIHLRLTPFSVDS